nr:FAD-dependent monooxygenase [Nocardia tengchongensis]
MLDAINLAWKLAADLHGGAPAGLLDSYHEERHFAGARIMMQTQAQVALRRGDDPAALALRALFQELLTDEPALRRVGALIAGTDLRYPLPNPNRHPLTGTVVPDLPLRTGQADTRVADLLRTARPSCSCSPTVRTYTRSPPTGPVASTSTPPPPTTGRPTPC